MAFDNTIKEKQLQAVQRRMQLNLYETHSIADDDTFLALLQTNGLINSRPSSLHVLIESDLFAFTAAELSILPLADIVSNTSALVWRISFLVVYMVWLAMVCLFDLFVCVCVCVCVHKSLADDCAGIGIR